MVTFFYRCMLLVLVFFSILHKSSGQNIDDIIDKHVQAMGGKEKMDSLKTLMIEGTFRVEEYELPLKAYLSHNIGERFDVSILKTSGFIIVTPDNGWQYLPFQGMKEPQPLKTGEKELYLTLIDLQGPLYNHAKKGNKINLEGLETIEDNVCYKMQVLLKSSQQLTVYVDTVSYYIVKTTIKNNMDGGNPPMIENLFGNFQKTADGYILPNAMTLGPGKMFIRKVIVNAPIAPSKFDPVSAKKEVTQ